MDEVREQVKAWLAQGQSVALATVVETWGSAPRGIGAKMAVSASGSMVGSVSGGCVEAAVVEAAMDVIQTGQAQLIAFGIADSRAWEVGLLCGGELTVLVERVTLDWWYFANNASGAGVLVTDLTVGRLGQKAFFTPQMALVWAQTDPARWPTLVHTLSSYSGKSAQRVSTPEDDLFIDCLLLPPHLVMIGGSHVAVALQHFAHILRYRVTLVDPRSAFATPERFPLVDRIVCAYPDEVLPSLALDEISAVVILSHDPKIDDPALQFALASPIPYVGVISSRKAHQERVVRLQAAGVDSEAIARIRTPIGLDIGARDPEEIALAIMAEVVMYHRRGQSKLVGNMDTTAH